MFEKLAVIDLDDTLYAYSPCASEAEIAVVKFLVEQTSLDSESVLTNLARARRRVKELIPDQGASHSRLLYFSQFMREIGCAGEFELSIRSEQLYWATFFQHMKPFKDTHSFLSSLRREGFYVCIRTDLTSQIQQRKVIHLGIDRLIDDLVSSETVGGDKVVASTWQKFFEVIQPQNPSIICFVGDSLNDLCHFDGSELLFEPSTKVFRYLLQSSPRMFGGRKQDLQVVKSLSEIEKNLHI